MPKLPATWEGQSSISGVAKLSTYVGAWVVRGFSNFSIIEKDTGHWIGHAGPWQPEGWPGPEVGWSLARSAWGKGYATEAAGACIDWVFNYLGWEEVIHIIDPENHPSIAVAKRLGSRRIGPTMLPAPFEASTVEAYGQSRMHRA